MPQGVAQSGAGESARAMTLDKYGDATPIINSF